MTTAFQRTARLATCAALLAACARSGDGGADSVAARRGADSATTTRDASAARDSSAILSERGLGLLRIGAGVAEASASVGGALAFPADADSTGCTYLDWRGGPAGVHVMSEAGRVVRIDVDSTGIATAAGTRVGDDAATVQRHYEGRAQVSPHKYTEGQYLTVVPGTPPDSTVRLVFEVERGRVTRFRAGVVPAVEYVEGCS